jgi:hypothetical protein
LWQEEGRADLILVTTNSIINSQNKLVMGRGAALEAASRYPTLAFDLAERIRPFGKWAYGVIIVPRFANGVQLGAFQVKFNWKDKADLGLIRISATRLSAIAEALPDWRIAMNFPGIGNGQLTEKEVQPYIETLPSNVFVYKKVNKE